jgi:hypothetical protein
MKALSGVAVVLVHAAVFIALAAHSGGHELTVELAGPRSIDGRVPDALASRVRVAEDGSAPGLVRRRWSVTYRGGFEREVGATALAGPFQDPGSPPCSGRVIVGQRLLDDLAGTMTKLIDDELRGESIFPIGDFRRIDGLTLRWAGANAEAPHGLVRATATIVFDRANVPLEVAFLPERTGASLHFRLTAHADLDFGNRVLDWVSRKLGASALASRLARRQIDDVLITTFAPPPPFELPDGQQLAFTFCDAPVEIVDGAYGALPFTVALGRLQNAPEILPPRLPAGVLPPPPPDTRLALDLDLNALDAMLYELWRTGWLDRRLDEVGLDRRFAADPTVATFLSIRLSPLRLALPPVISAGPHGALRLAADARVAIADGSAVTNARVFGALNFRFSAPTEAVAVDVGALELACERTPTTLVPCYADLVSALRDRGSEFHGALTTAFAHLLAEIFVDRHLTAPGLPADLALRGVTPSLVGAPPVLRLQLDATLAQP